MATSSLLSALRICLSSSQYVSSSSRAAASRTCIALRQPGPVPFGHQDARQGASHRRQAAFQVAEAAQAGGSLGGSGAGSNLGGGGGAATADGSPPWQQMEAALGRRQPEVAWREFMQLLEQGILPPSSQCDKLIYALCKARRFQEAWRAYAAITPAGYCLQYNTYQALINQALKVGNLDAALDAFRDLQSLGLSANVVTYCGLISALGKERRRGVRYAQTAHELWSELAGSGTQLDSAAYRTGIKACVDVGRLREADKLLQRMTGAGVPPDVRAYNILLAGHGRAGNTSAMGRLLARMSAAGVELTCVTYNTLVDGYVRAKDLAAAEATVAKAAGAGVELDVWTWSTLIKGYVQAGKLAAAEKALGDMAAAGVQPSTVAYTTLIDGHVRAGDMAAARRVLQAMQAAGVAPNDITYNTLLRGYGVAAAGSGSSSSSRAASVAAEAASGAETTVAAASATTATATADPFPLAAAQQVLQDMQAQGLSPTVQTFNTLMSAAVAAGEHRLALDMCQRLRTAGLQPDGLTYTVLIQAHGRLGQVVEAAASFEALLRDRSAAVDIRAYNAMVDALARNGDMEAAERLLERASEMASKQGLPPPVEAYGAVVAGHARQLAVDPAVAVVRRFHAAGGSPDAQMLDILANIAIRAGDYKVAMQAVRALELIGRDVDKGRYATLLEEVRARRGDALADADRPQHNRTWAAYQRRRDARRKNVQLERLKWLLGLPNRYYSADETGSDSDSEADLPPSPSPSYGVSAVAVEEYWDEYEQPRWQNQRW